MLSDLLRNLTFNRSAHCTQVSDQCPLGLLFNEFLMYLFRKGEKRGKGGCTIQGCNFVKLSRGHVGP